MDPRLAVKQRYDFSYPMRVSRENGRAIPSVVQQFRLKIVDRGIDDRGIDDRGDRAIWRRGEFRLRAVLFEHFLVLITFATSRLEVKDQVLHVQS